jgi:hypothetical protein
MYGTAYYGGQYMEYVQYVQCAEGTSECDGDSAAAVAAGAQDTQLAPGFWKFRAI